MTLKGPATLGTNNPATLFKTRPSSQTRGDTHGSVDAFSSVLEPSASREEVVCHWLNDVAFCGGSDVQQAEQGRGHGINKSEKDVGELAY